MKTVTKFLALIFLSLIGASPLTARAQGSSMTEITEAVRKLCGATGKRSEFTVKGGGSVGASKAVSLVVDGKVSGEASFTNEEWDGVRAVQNDSAGYTSCVQKLTPIFIDKFAAVDNTFTPQGVKKWDVSFGIQPLRDFCAANQGVPPPVGLLNPPQQAGCQNGTMDPRRPICLCP